MSKVFSAGSIMPNRVILPEYTNIDTSFTREAYEFALESKKEYNSLVRELYEAITESQTEEAINESFDGFFRGALDIVRKFLKFIKGIFDRFINMLAKAIRSDAYIIDNKKAFERFDEEEHKFKHKGFSYVFKSHIPMNNVSRIEFMEDFFDLKDPEKDLEQVTLAFSDKLANNFYDQFRATVIDRHGEYISNDAFPKVLFSIYRGNTSSAESFPITKARLEDAFGYFSEYKETISSVEAMQKEIIVKYTEIEDYITNMIRVVGVSANDPMLAQIKNVDGKMNEAEIRHKAMELINKFIKGKVDQLNEMSAIHTMAVGAKLDAYKDRHNQEREILYTALMKIQGGEGKEVKND